MAEKGIVREFKTPEVIKEAGTEYLRKQGVKKVGYREVFAVKETEAGIEICGGTAMNYYFDDKQEEAPMISTCIDFPKEFLPQLKAIVEELIK